MSDDDDLHRLATALRQAPRPDAAARDRALLQAMESFDQTAPTRQGSARPARQGKDRPLSAALTGVLEMLKSLTTRPALAATTSIAALCLGVIAVLPVIDRGLPALRGAVDAPGGLPDAAPAKAAAPRAKTAAPPASPLPAPAETMARRESAAPAGSAMEAEGMVDEAVSDAGLAAAGAPATVMLAEPAIAPEAMLSSEPAPAVAPDTETFANAPAHPVIVTAEQPVSTFSVDVDTASYAVVRASLNSGFLPEPAAVRIEEMVNYFPYAYPAPTPAQTLAQTPAQTGDQPFSTTLSVMPTPWNPDTRLVRIALQGRLPVTESRPPLNLVLLIDTSGSMDEPAKLPLLKQSLALMLGQLRPDDQVAIVAYAGSAGQVLAPTAAADRDTILSALDDLSAGGPTAGAEGLALAYRTAAAMAAPEEVSRILLATDGDFNLGISDPAGLTALVARERDRGVYLSVLGFGRGNLDDATMQALAQNGNGTAAYIDTLAEAQKALSDQLTGALFPIANDVKVQVEWNPATVAEYRLIGYETRALRREDFRNDRVDAGEIGAGHQVTALYEVAAPGAAGLRHDPLRYGTPSAGAIGIGAELGFLRLRWKAPGATASQLTERAILPDMPADDEARFAAAIAGFGQLLQGSVYLGDWGWDQAIALATEARGPDAFGYRAEAITLMRLAESLSR